MYEYYNEPIHKSHFKNLNKYECESNVLSEGIEDSWKAQFR